MEALTLFEACLQGNMAHVPRRPHDRERGTLIKSGHVFIYEEHSSGIKRWTDGVNWSPSRILGNFLLYRELEKPFQPGEKKRANKRNKSEASGSMATSATASVDQPNQGRDNRALIGSLVDSYPFKENGLIKKTISVNLNSVVHHLVSYYTIDDVEAHRLKSPCQDSACRDVIPRPSLYSQANFRAPIDDTELAVVDPSQAYYSATMGYGDMNTAQQRSVSFSSPSFVHPQVAWPSTSPYLHGSAYDTTPAIAQTFTSYGQHGQTTPSYYDEVSPYRENPYPSYGAVVPNRRHSVIPSTHAGNQMAYSAPMMPNGTMAIDHSLPAHAFGEMFPSQAANAVVGAIVDNGAQHHAAHNHMDHHNLSSALQHGTTGFDHQLTNGYGNHMNRLSMSDYVSASGGPMAMDNSNISPEDEEWRKAEQFIAKSESEF